MLKRKARAGTRSLWGAARAALVAASVAASMPALAAAEWSASLPTFSACKSATPPALPARWHAVGLMAPFSVGQLDVGEFVYDAALPAMRATVYGLESGAVDLLITGTDTYRLTGPHRAPTGCTSLGRKFAPPPAQWLSGQAVCVGEAPLAKIATQWWKTPTADDKSNWHWIKSASGLPWRSLFVAPSPDPAIIGDYSLTYFPTFTPLPETNLPRLRDFCAAQAPAAAGANEATEAKTARALMAVGNEAAEAERGERIAALIPGLSHKACSLAKPVRWPDQFVMTAILTPISFKERPYSTLIYYDWSDAASQLAIMLQDNPPVT